MRIASLAFEILPLVALFIGNSIYNIFIGAAASVGLAAVILLFTWLKEKRLARFVIFFSAYFHRFNNYSVLGRKLAFHQNTT